MEYLSDRALKIFEATVENFIKTGEPVSSGWLYKNYDFGIKPAMIRFELENLAERGLLQHPYHSAGRVPSDRGFELFARYILSQPDSKTSSNEESFSDLFAHKDWEDFLGKLSAELGILGVLQHDQAIYKNGIENLVEHLEWETQAEIKTVIRDFVEIDSRLVAAEEIIEQTPDVLIGKKNAITKSRCLAVIGGVYEVGNERVAIFAIGPKRMDYRKTLKIFKNLKRKTSKKKTEITK